MVEEGLPRARFAFADILPLFDPQSVLLYTLIGVTCLLSAALVRFGGWSIRLDWLLDKPIWAGIIVFTATMLRRAGRVRLSTFLETAILIYVQGIAALILLLLLIPFSAPMADNALASADAALGFHWPTLASAVAARPLLSQALTAAYDSFDWQGPALVGLLAYRGQVGRAWHFTTAALLTLLLSTPIFLLLPAADPAAHFGSATDVATLAPQTAIEVIKAGSRIINMSDFIGIMSMPSYHAAAALLFIWGGWNTPVRWPLLGLNAAMCFAAIPIGNHYLVDVLAGIVVAALSINLCGYQRESDGRPEVYPGTVR